MTLNELLQVLWWENPRAKKRVKKNGIWVDQEQKVMHQEYAVLG